MSDPVRVMVEKGKKKRSVASAFDWPGWDRSAKTEEAALEVLAEYRPRYAKVAELAGLADEFGATGDLEVVERIDGIGMTDFYGVSMRSAQPEYEQMTDTECDRKIELLRAAWATFDDTASRVSAELRKGRSVMTGLREDDRTLLIVDGRVARIGIPKRAFPTADSISEFRAEVVERIRRSHRVSHG